MVWEPGPRGLWGAPARTESNVTPVSPVPQRVPLAKARL